MRMLVIAVALCGLIGEASAQRVVFSYAGSNVTVVVDSSIWAGFDSGNTRPDDDYPAGLVVFGATNEQDGSKAFARAFEGTHYYKRKPDTLVFTSSPGITQISVIVLHDTLGDNWKGLYNVTVGGVKHKISASNIVYMYKLRPQQLRVNYTGSNVRVVVDSSIWAGVGSSNADPTDDYPAGLFMYGSTNEQDGSRGFIKVFEGTNYHKRKPDTLDFTSQAGIQTLFFWAMHEQPGDVWKGVYNVRVNDVSYRVGPSNVVYLNDPRVPVPDLGAQPLTFALDQNFPNPFNPSTRIGFSLAERSHVTLSVFNILGEQVSVLVDSEVDAGVHAANFDASTIPSGVYFYRLQAGGAVRTRKLTVLK